MSIFFPPARVRPWCAACGAALILALAPLFGTGPAAPDGRTAPSFGWFRGKSLPVAAAAALPAGPVPISEYGKADSAGRSLLLRWHKVRDDVAYELRLSARGKVFYTGRFYVNGAHLVLPADFREKSFMWQVRVLAYDGSPATEFSRPRKALVDGKTQAPVYPLPLNGRNLLEAGAREAAEGLRREHGALVPAREQGVPAGVEAPEVYPYQRGTTVLYPVYKWVHVDGADHYEVEILRDLPVAADREASAEKVIDRLYTTHFDAYDDMPRVSWSPMYWRVRALDKEGRPLGVFSPPQRFTVNPLDHYDVATLGDSITHGGGSVSGAPSDWEYDYQCYLDFDTVNLGRSGDTSADILARFDRDVLPFRPRYVLIMAGTNSLRGAVPASSVIADLEALRRKCAAHGIRPVFLTLLPLNPDNIRQVIGQETAPDWQEKWAQVNRYIRTQPHIDLSTKFTEGKPLPTSLSVDGLHPGVEGKRRIAEAINEQWNAVTGQGGIP